MGIYTKSYYMHQHPQWGICPYVILIMVRHVNRARFGRVENVDLTWNRIVIMKKMVVYWVRGWLIGEQVRFFLVSELKMLFVFLTCVINFFMVVPSNLNCGYEYDSDTLFI